MKHYKIKVEGDVQGVFYRSSAKNKAQELGINGYASNQNDGSVFIEAEGKEHNLQQLIKWCEEGPDTAKVSHVEYQEGDVKNYEKFEIK
ncbi:MAG: acylphosphatase [Candidatus Cyclobacteriaceae bacterium M2_1C_046]